MGLYGTLVKFWLDFKQKCQAFILHAIVMRISSVKTVLWLAVNLHQLFSDGAAFNTQSRRSLTNYAISRSLSHAIHLRFWAPMKSLSVRDTHNLYCMDGHLLKLKCKYSNILRYWFLIAYTHTHTHTHIYIYIYIYIHIHTHTHILLFYRVVLYVCICICIYTTHDKIIKWNNILVIQHWAFFMVLMSWF